MEQRHLPAAAIFAAQGNGYDFPDRFFTSPAADFSLIRQSFNTVLVQPGHQDVVDAARAAGLNVILEFDYKWDFANGTDIGPQVAAVVAQVRANPGAVAGIIVADQLNTWANPDNGRPAIDPDTMLAYLQATGGAFHQQLPGIPVYTDVEDAELTADQPGQASSSYLFSPTSLYRYETNAVLTQLYQSGNVDGFFLADNLLNWDATAQARAWQTARSLWPEPFALVPRMAGLSFPDSVYPDDAAYAERQTTAAEVIPLQQGADGIDLWGWHIPWTDNGVPGVRTWLNKDGSTNPLWEAMQGVAQNSIWAPAAPTNLAATAVSSSRVDLSWADNSGNEAGFKVYASSDGVRYAWIATAATNATAYTWWGASPGTAYSFYVAADNAAGNSAPSNTAAVTTPAPPAAPGNLTAVAVSGSQISLTWADNSNNEAGFKVYTSSDGVHYGWVGTAGANATGYSWWGASPGTTYSFRVTAYNAVGESAPSDAAGVTVPAPPAAPSNLAATAVSASRVNLSWANNATNQDGFKLYYSTDGVNWVWFAQVAASATTYTWGGASPNTSYSFRVTAYNVAGDSAASNTAGVTVPAPPAAPSDLAATAVSASRVDLTWTDNANDEAGFRLYYSLDGVNWVWFAEVGPGATGYTWWGASPGTTYYFRVTAYNANGKSDPSNTASATTPG